MYTETAHFLRDHPGLCKHWHGHSYKWTVVVGAETLTNDMVLDFGQLKEIMHDVIGPYDHALIVDKQEMQDIVSDTFDCSRVIVLSHRPTAERMAACVYSEIREMLPPGVKLIKVICRETRNNEACYSED